MLEKYKSLCEDRQKIIKSQDKGNSRVYHLAKNGDRNLVRHYQIDGVVIDSASTKKCDFLLINDGKRNAYLIELKGTDILSALEQLENTECILRNELAGYQMYYRIVYRANTHGIRASRYTKFVAKKGIDRVLAKTNCIEENI